VSEAVGQALEFADKAAKHKYIRPVYEQVLENVHSREEVSHDTCWDIPLRVPAGFLRTSIAARRSVLLRIAFDRAEDGR
jgi:hypothetical protein